MDADIFLIAKISALLISFFGISLLIQKLGLYKLNRIRNLYKNQNNKIKILEIHHIGLGNQLILVELNNKTILLSNSKERAGVICILNKYKKQPKYQRDNNDCN